MRISSHWLSPMAPVPPCFFEYRLDTGLGLGNDRSSQNITVFEQSLTSTSTVGPPGHMRKPHMHWRDFFNLLARNFRWLMAELKEIPERDNRKPTKRESLYTNVMFLEINLHL